MISDFFRILNTDDTVKAVFGSSPLRVYLSEAPPNPVKPYAVYTIPNAAPENYLGNAPDIDNISVQCNVYAKNYTELKQAFGVLRTSLEADCHLVRYAINEIDRDTDLYSVRMEFDFKS